MKVCNKCQVLKDETEFARKNDGRGGLRAYCRACASNYMKEWYQTNRERTRMQQSEYIQGNKAKIYALNKKRNRKIKLEVLGHYSNGVPRRLRCGITDPDVLCIDHIDGGGTKGHQREIPRGSFFYRILRKSGYPGGYQVLCANCNMKKFIVEGK